VKTVLRSCFLYALLVFIVLLLSSIGCKDDSTQPKTPTLTNFLIREFRASDTTFIPIDTQKAGTGFNITVTARDQNNDTLKSYTGTAIISVTGSASFLPETTDVFEDGWASQSILIADTGKFTITARQTGGSHTGTSNEFHVVPSSGLSQSFPTNEIASGRTKQKLIASKKQIE